MEVINLQAENTIPFVFERVLSTWDMLYDLYTGQFVAQMRTTPDSLNVIYEWSTGRGNMTVQPVKALGLFSFLALPLAGDTIKLGETTVTFVAGVPGANEVQIDSTITGTVGRLLTFLQGSSDFFIELCNYSRAGNDISVEYGESGYTGNAFVIGASGPVERIVVSGDTLEAGGTLLTMTASVFDIQSFLDEYWYDVRFENELGPQAIPFGGTITWTQGVTR